MAASPAARIAATGAGCPVISSTWRAAWCSSMSKPGHDAPPTRRGPGERGRPGGVDDVEHAPRPAGSAGRGAGGPRRQRGDEQVAVRGPRPSPSAAGLPRCPAGPRRQQAPARAGSRTRTTADGQAERGQGRDRRAGGRRPRRGRPPTAARGRPRPPAAPRPSRPRRCCAPRRRRAEDQGVDRPELPARAGRHVASSGEGAPPSAAWSATARPTRGPSPATKPASSSSAHSTRV